MNNILIPLIISTIAGLSTLLGGVVVFFNIKNRSKFLSFALSFSLSVMISISVFELIPESIVTLYKMYGLLPSLLIGVGGFIVGVSIVSKINNKIDKISNNNLYNIGILSMIALMIHNLPEGILTFMTSFKDLSMGISLAIAIMLHNVPEGISISVPIYYSTGNKLKSILYTFISGLSEPLGALLAYLLLRNIINDLTISLILILVSGIMISLSINDILPEVNSYKNKKQSIIGMILGSILVLINLILF